MVFFMAKMNYLNYCDNYYRWFILISKRFFRRLKFAFKFDEIITWQYESCQRCGHCFKLNWSARDDKWLEVLGNEDGCLCIDCFIEVAKEKNVIITQHDIERMEIFNPIEENKMIKKNFWRRVVISVIISILIKICSYFIIKLLFKKNEEDQESLFKREPMPKSKLEPENNDEHDYEGP
jgi:hypothetical protein